jgi:hypothetical protein
MGRRLKGHAVSYLEKLSLFARNVKKKHCPDAECGVQMADETGHADAE